MASIKRHTKALTWAIAQSVCVLGVLWLLGVLITTTEPGLFAAFSAVTAIIDWLGDIAIPLFFAVSLTILIYLHELWLSR